MRTPTVAKYNRYFDRFYTDLAKEVADFFALSRSEYSPHFPPYNIYNVEEKTVLELACAGFSKNDIEVYVEDNHLVVEGKRTQKEKETSKQRNFFHKGIAERNFRVSYPMHRDYEVESVTMENGIVRILLRKKDHVPPRRINYEVT